MIFLWLLLSMSTAGQGQWKKFTLIIHLSTPLPGLVCHEAYPIQFKDYKAVHTRLEMKRINDHVWIGKGELLYPTAIRVFSSIDSITINKLFFIQPGKQVIILTGNGINDSIVSNSSVEIEHREFLRENDIASLDEKINGVSFLSYVKKHPQSYVAFFTLLNQSLKYPYPSVFLKINQAFTHAIKDTKAFHFYSTLYLVPNDVNDRAPDFLFKDVNNKTTTLRSFKNKFPVILYFWASWCPYCVRLTPFLKSELSQSSLKNIKLIAISDDEDTAKWRKAIAEEGVQRWIQLMNVSFREAVHPNSSIEWKYFVKFLPTVIIVDKGGKIFGRYSGDDDTILREIDNALKKVSK